jgi:TetR/AcrR family transcriptional regulator, repressor for uid operon
VSSFAAAQDGPNLDIPPAKRILEAAKILFASKGFELTTTAMIARQAATSESQIVKYFESKEGVLVAVFNDAWSRIAQQLEALRSSTSGADRLEAVVMVMLKTFRVDPALKELMLFEGRRMRREGELLLTSGYLSLIRIVDESLHEMKSAGQLRPELDIQAVRSALIGMFEGMLRDQTLGERSTYPANYSLEAMQMIFRRAVSAFLQDRRG